MRLVRAIRNSNSAYMSPHLRQRCILANSLCTIRLHGPVDHIKGHVRHEDLGLCDFGKGGFSITSINRRGRIQDNKSGSVDLDARFGNPLEYNTLLGKKFAKGFLVLSVCARKEPAESFFGLGKISNMQQTQAKGCVQLR